MNVGKPPTSRDPDAGAGEDDKSGVVRTYQAWKGSNVSFKYSFLYVKFEIFFYILFGVVRSDFMACWMNIALKDFFFSGFKGKSL